MNHRERMLAGLPYQAWKDGLDVARLENKKKIFAFNNMPPQGWEPVTAALKNILGKTGEDVYIEAPSTVTMASTLRSENTSTPTTIWSFWTYAR